MEPFYKNSLIDKKTISLNHKKNTNTNNSISYNIPKKISKSMIRYSTEEQDHNIVKSFSKHVKPSIDSYNTVELNNIKKSRSLIRKKSELK